MTMKHIIEESLQDWLDLLPASRIKEAMGYSLLGGGKRIRPLLLLSCLKDFDLDPLIGLDAACALEMVHTYSLIHDDLPAMDDDELRRGRLTSHKMYDEATAILAGDGLLTIAFEILANSSYSDPKKVALIRELAKASGSAGMILGQTQDIAFENNPSVDVLELTTMYGNKTGKLLACALRMAGIIANREADLDKHTLVGENAGIAFQIQDDILDVTKTTQELGKTANSDIVNNKSTVVSLLGPEKALRMMRKYYNLAFETYDKLGLKSNEVHKLLELLINRQN
ncbi:MAG: polyprenyl synthetase family protein [Erysipelotrichales bacterium]|nr:MAG: polyprenyl synthetase family protein [Erysipelotrichales bacterium]